MSSGAEGVAVAETFTELFSSKRLELPEVGKSRLYDDQGNVTDSVMAGRRYWFVTVVAQPGSVAIPFGPMRLVATRNE